MKRTCCIITGAAGGFGQEFIRQLLGHYDVIIAFDLNADQNRKVLTNLSSTTSTVIAFQGDVSRDEDWQRLTRLIDQKKLTITLLVNNAGFAHAAPWEEHDIRQILKAIDINLGGVIRGTHWALERMDTGSIINIASVAGLIPSPYLTNYSCAKHGIVGLTRSLQHELRLQNRSPHLLLVCPGFANTAIVQQQNFQLPEWITKTLPSAQSIVTEIINALEHKKLEVHPGLSGKWMPKLFQYLPEFLFNGLTQRMIRASQKPTSRDTRPQ